MSWGIQGKYRGLRPDVLCFVFEKKKKHFQIHLTALKLNHGETVALFDKK